VIPCRVMSKPLVSFAIDSGPWSERRETRPSRVSSPRAAKTGAEPASSAFALTLLRKVFLDERDDHRPASLVSRKGLGAALEGNTIEAGLRHRQHHAMRLFLQPELDEGRRLVRVVDIGFHRERVPSE